tara:strand:- start:644 stop:940 length:297 start_codon:yes stop_codon:yes gene_type:complete
MENICYIYDGNNNSILARAIKYKIMGDFKNIFKESNEYNEKTIIGFIAFIIMILIMLADLITGWCGKDLVINEFVYDSFLFLVLGCFGIAGLEKFAKK